MIHEILFALLLVVVAFALFMVSWLPSHDDYNDYASRACDETGRIELDRARWRRERDWCREGDNQ